MDIKTALQTALISTGRIAPKDRIEIIEKCSDESDYVRVGLYAFHGRKQKPFVYWNICVDIARELIHVDSSSFYFL